MDWSLIAWMLWAVAFTFIEGVALFNSTPGDTLSEHVWAFIGIRSRDKTYSRFVTPKWTLRLARFAVVSGLVWLVIHLTTDWM